MLERERVKGGFRVRRKEKNSFLPEKRKCERKGGGIKEYIYIAREGQSRAEVVVDCAISGTQKQTYSRNSRRG